MNKRQKKKLADVLLWQKLKLIGGEKQDTYVRVFSSNPVGSGALYKGDYARVREAFEDDDDTFVWLQNKKQRAEQVLHASWDIDNGGSGLPYMTHEFEIVWKDGKPV